MTLTRRRLALLACALAAWSPFAVPQPVRSKARVAMLYATNPDATKHLRPVFAARMAELGWHEGTSIEYTSHYAESDPAVYDRLAAEAVARKPDLIWVGYGPLAAVVKKHTKDIPIVFAISSDPVGQGLVASLARPGGNATGVSTRSQELIGKRLQLLKEALPSVSRIGLVRRTGAAATSETEALHEGLKRAVAKLGLTLVEVEHERFRGGDFEPAFAQLKAKQVDAVASVLQWNYPLRRDFARHALQARVPTICDATEYVEAGGLMSLSVSYAERYRKSAEYVDRILRGAKPAELPVEEPTVFEFVVNLRSARALGLKIPQSILLRADRVIE